MRNEWQAILDRARGLDSVEPWVEIRKAFYIPEGTTYLDGNSLGLLSRNAERSILAALDDWKRLGIDGWTHGSSPWFFMAEEIGRRIATLIGAERDEVVTASSTTVNLHQMLATLFRPNGIRDRILMD